MISLNRDKLTRNNSRISPFKSLLLATATAVALFLSASTLQAAENIQTSTTDDGQELILNGIGRAKQLSDSFFIGALYLQQPFRSVDNITYINNYKRMQLRIASKRVSARRFAQYWKEVISINSPRNVWEPQVKDVLAFTAFFKKALKKGDIVDLDYIPGTGTFINVNGVTIGRIRNPGFYNLLIMTWLGNRPPNEQFKLGVMGGNDGDTAIKLQREFISLTPTSKRIAETKAWLTESEPAKKTTKKTLVKKKPTQKKVTKKKLASKAPAKKTVVKKAPTKTVAKTPNKAKPKTDSSTAAKVVASAAETAAKLNKPVTIEINNNNKPSAKKANTKSQPSKPAKKAVKPPKELTSSEKLKLYALRNSYEKELRKTIRKYQKYPLRKMLRNRLYKKQMEKGPIESEGVLWIKIGRSGSVISSRLEQSTGITILDQSAVEMVEKADPLPEMPKELAGGEFEFLVQLKFVSPQLN